MNAMSEQEIQAKIIERLNRRRDVRVFRNNNGVGFIGTEYTEHDDKYELLRDLARLSDKILESLHNSSGPSLTQIFMRLGLVVLGFPRRIRFGLHPGSSDLIGWKSVTITPDMVGKKVAVFLSPEIKSERGRLRDEQKNWIEQVSAAGGISLVVRAVEDAEKI
jgi:hypothetical protein